MWKVYGSSISIKAREWTEKRCKQREPYNLYIKRKQWRDPPPTPELMEEACSDDSFNLPPPEAPERQEEAEVNRITVPEQAGTVSTTGYPHLSESKAPIFPKILRLQSFRHF